MNLNFEQLILSQGFVGNKGFYETEYKKTEDDWTYYIRKYIQYRRGPRWEFVKADNITHKGASVAITDTTDDQLVNGWDEIWQNVENTMQKELH